MHMDNVCICLFDTSNRGVSMLTTNELLDLAREVQGGVSDYRLAQLLDVDQPRIPGYRAKRSKPSNSVSARLGELCALDPLVAVCWVNIERCSTEDEREVWRLVLARLNAEKAPVKAAPKRQNVAVYKSGEKVANPRHA